MSIVYDFADIAARMKNPNMIIVKAETEQTSSPNGLAPSEVNAFYRAIMAREKAQYEACKQRVLTASSTFNLPDLRGNVASGMLLGSAWQAQSSPSCGKASK